MPQPLQLIDRAEADRFLQLLHKKPDAARLRAFPHKLNPLRAQIGARKGPFDIREADRWQSEGRGVYIVINDGGDKKEEITSCIAFFIEWDNRPIDWQLKAWEPLGLKEPTCIVTTGGKSAHLYWVLSSPVTPAQWAPVQAKLIDFCGADPACKDASRVMRLPGAAYIGPQGKPTGKTILAAASGNTYTLAEVASWITTVDEFAFLDNDEDDTPSHEDPFAGVNVSGYDDKPRSLEEIHEALTFIPRRVPGNNTYTQYRNILWSLIRACEEAGSNRDMAIALMESHSPSSSCGWDVAQTADYNFRQVNSDTFWWHARQHGWRPAEPVNRKQSAQSASTAGTSDQKQSNAQQQAPKPSAPPVLTLEEVRDRLAYAVSNGASRQDLEALRIELAEASGINHAALRDLLRSIEQEQEADQSIAAEVASLRAEADRKGIAQEITLERLLPPSIAHALRIRCRALPVDDIAAVMTYLVTISGVVKLGSELVASEAADYRVPLNLYGALVARSGAKKSPLSRLIVNAPTHEIRTDLARQHTRALEQWQEDNRGVKPSERTDPPKACYLSISDTTVEALAAQLQIQEERGMGLLLHRDELAGMFGSLGQYKNGRGGDEEHLLEAYDGSGFRSLRVATVGGGRFYDRCHLSIWGSIQPAVLEELVADGDASGLWARFIFVPLPEKVVPIAASETFEEQQQSQAAAASLAQICEDVFRMPRTSLSLSPEARAAFVRYEATCQAEALKASIAAQGALMGKSAGKALRIAALLHLIHQAAPDGSRGPQVELHAMEWACLLTDQLNAWTLGLHATVATGGANDLMRLIHRVASATQSPIRWKEVLARLSKKQRKEIDSAAVAKAMEALAELGVGEVERTDRGSVSYRATSALS
jgi:hypothetical protein